MSAEVQRPLTTGRLRRLCFTTIFVRPFLANTTLIIINRETKTCIKYLRETRRDSFWFDSKTKKSDLKKRNTTKNILPRQHLHNSRVCPVVHQ